MKNRILTLALALLLTLSLTTVLAPPVFASEDYNGVDVDEWWGDFGMNGTALVAYRGPGGDIVIPYGVTKIGTWITDPPFQNNTSITNVTIPDSVTYIGPFAFDGCTSLASITIPDSVTSIGDSAFQVCTSLTSIFIPNSVTEIGDAAFAACTSLTSVTIPNSVTELRSTFSDCTSLTSVTIPNSVAKLSGTFMGCTSLTSITIPSSVTEIGAAAFHNCTSLTNVSLPKSVKVENHPNQAGAFENTPCQAKKDTPRKIIGGVIEGLKEEEKRDKIAKRREEAQRHKKEESW